MELETADQKKKKKEKDLTLLEKHPTMLNSINQPNPLPKPQSSETPNNLHTTTAPIQPTTPQTPKLTPVFPSSYYPTRTKSHIKKSPESKKSPWPNKRHLSSTPKDFQLPDIVSDLRMHLQQLSRPIQGPTFP